MSLPRRGARRIRVGETDYLWLVRPRPTYAQAVSGARMTVAIESCEPRARRILLVALNVTRPDNWIYPHRTGLHPADIRRIIVEALTRGWVPTDSGAPFRHQYGLIIDNP